MPNHWDSSARPLFVKTVFVNGSRHAILFEKDPLRCVNSPLKKTSRPNSSLSFASDLSISSSEGSQNTNSKCKTFNLKNVDRSQDLSSELQSCLIKFKISSSSLKSINKTSEEKCFCHLKTESREKENSKQKASKGNRGKNDKLCKHFFEEQNEYELTERKNSENKSCYIYNLENYKRRKNYSFVKITSHPPQFLLNCSCENDWDDTHNRNKRNKSNLVISASIKNLIMTPDENENVLEKTLDYVLPFENSELNWNNHITKSYYNSLAERVFQWLDLARKRKKPPEKLNLKDDTDCGTSVERIYSGKKFAEEIKKNEALGKSRNKNLNTKKNGKLLQSDTSEEEIEEKVIREQYVETLLSLENEPRECSKKTSSLEEVACEIVEDKPQRSVDLLVKSSPLSSTKESAINAGRTPHKIQNLFVNSPSKENNSYKNHNGKKTKEPRNASTRQNKKETDLPVTEEARSVFTEKSDSLSKHSPWYCSKSLDKYGDDINSQILTEEFAERNQKSINNLNITRTRTALIQNLSPQQHDKISSFEEERIVWVSEKSTGRPQLHIFMPSVLLKDQSDDSLSECETFLNL